MSEQVDQLDELAALVLNDPQLANLREVLWVEKCPDEDRCGGCGPGCGSACACQGTNRVRRTWDGPDWWLKSLVVRAAIMDGAKPRHVPLGFLNSWTYPAILTALKVKA